MGGFALIDAKGPRAIKAWVADLRDGYAGKPQSTFTYGSSPEQIVEHWPAAGKALHKTVVSIHGGAFMADIDLTSHHPLCQTLQARGFEVYNVEYRRAGSAPSASDTLSDAALAVRAVLTRCQGEVAVVGHSAGGYLAESVADIADVSLVMSLAPVTDLWGWESATTTSPLMDWLGTTPDAAENLARRLSLDPSREVSAARILVHGTDDAVVPIALSRGYVDRASRSGKRIEFVELPDEGHFAFIDPTEPAFDLVARRLESATPPPLDAAAG